MALPDFLVIGVPKAGTTALHAALTRHPQLFLPAVKEPKFFLTAGPPPARGGPGDAQTYQEHVWRQQDYEALFDPAPVGTLRGEATPFYLYDLDAQNRICRLAPKARLVVLLRNPVDRAHSNWTHLWAAGLEPERDFVRACALEESRRDAGWAAFWHYVSLGRYGEQLAHLFGLFPREQVLVLRYRDLRDSPEETLDRVCAFLGVATGTIGAVPSENVTPFVADSPVNTVLRAALRTGGRIGAHFPVPVRRAVRGPLLTALQRQSGGRPRLTPAQRSAVLPYFTADIARLEEVTGLPYGDWLTVGVEPDVID
ncbi:Sulfotransferase family protein [Frankia sp. AiPs1]|uniref:sulfotransferase family protein n=1 Tax=Frankia sp. AiPa1 TaxID=573492 RepID=UPI00202B7796|nr:sulfotransferase [Frankia sp. AiPa1]MCL9762059.1 sulfotransferase [Frankia sp. AiPa1]